MERSVNIHEAKTHLSRLIDEAVAGRSFQIAKAGRPLVTVTAIAPSTVERRLGRLAGKATLPKDIKTPFASEIARMFYGTTK